MNGLATLVLSSTACLRVARTWLLCVRNGLPPSGQVAVAQASASGPLLVVRDTLGQWLTDGCPADRAELQTVITRVTTLQSCWLPCESPVVTDAQLAHMPFQAHAQLATMALQMRQTVHLHRLTLWGWASSYVPTCDRDGAPALLLLFNEARLGARDHALATSAAEILCNAWTHFPHRSGQTAITPA